MTINCENPFTIDVTSAGFTDQLIELQFFGMLGQSLGMSYVFSPIQETRTKIKRSLLKRLLGLCGLEKSTNIHDILGVNDALQSQSENTFSGTWHDIEISSELIQKFGITSYEDLLTAVAEEVHQHPTCGIRLKLSGSKKFFRLQRQSDDPCFVDFETCIKQARKRWLLTDWNREDNILLHFRAGDLAVVETEKQSYIPVRKGTTKRLQEQSSSIDADLLWIGPHEYIEKVLSQKIDFNNSDTILCSDGYDRAIDLLKMDLDSKRKLRRFSLSKLSQLFSKMTPSQYHSVGETHYDLLALINALMTCKVVVTKDSGVLVLKFLLLFRSNNLPNIYLLHTGTRPDYNIVDLSQFKDHLRFIQCVRD